MKYSLPLLVLVLTGFLTGCSSDSSPVFFEDSFLVGRPDTVVVKEDSSITVRVFYGKGVLNVYRASIVWTTSDDQVATATNGEKTVSGDSCFSISRLTAGTISDTCTITATMSFAGVKHSVSFPVKSIVKNYEDNLLQNVPEGAFAESLGRRNFAMMKMDSGGVTIDKKTYGVKGFYICTTEVSRGLWGEVMKIFPIYDRNNYFAVRNVSWNEAQAFIAALNERTGRHYRLPTNLEWQFAATGGVKTHGSLYSGSNEIKNVAWYYGNSKVQGVPEVHAVGKLHSNELGLYDMTGNVWEWVGDYGSNGQSTERWARGASYADFEGASVLTKMGWNLDADAKQETVGLRLALSVEDYEAEEAAKNQNP